MRKANKKVKKKKLTGEVWSKYALLMDWEHEDIEDQVHEPDEGDLTTEDHVNFYQYGRHVLTLQVRQAPSYVGERGLRTRDAKEGELSDAAMWRQLDTFMKKAKFFPNVWWISDHGNAHLVTKPKRVRKQSGRSRDRFQTELKAAEVKYGDAGEPYRFVAGGWREHWPKAVKDKLRKLSRAR